MKKDNFNFLSGLDTSGYLKNEKYYLLYTKLNITLMKMKIQELLRSKKTVSLETGLNRKYLNLYYVAFFSGDGDGLLTVGIAESY